MDVITQLHAAALHDPVGAATAMARMLMAGDPAACKAGYSRANAVIAAAEYLHLTDTQRAALERRLAAK